MADPDKIRLFVAASIPREHLEHVAEEIEPFRKKVSNARWLEVDNQHVTLKFLGSTPTDRLGEIEKVCEIVGSSHKPASLSIGGIGVFPTRSRVRVLWVGLSDETRLLERLAADLDQGFEPLGFPTESRAFTPHLTLCRFKIPVPLKGGLPTVDTESLTPFDVSSIELFRSHLSPKGARYEVLRSFDLGN